MNDKKDLSLSVMSMVEWCARYWNLTHDDEEVNWELYAGEQLVAYNYEVADGYISKYAASGVFPYPFILDVRHDKEKWIYNITKKF